MHEEEDYAGWGPSSPPFNELGSLEAFNHHLHRFALQQDPGLVRASARLGLEITKLSRDAERQCKQARINFEDDHRRSEEYVRYMKQRYPMAFTRLLWCH